MAIDVKDYNIASFALWAGDYYQLDFMAKRSSKEDKITEYQKFPQDLINKIEKHHLDHYIERRNSFLKEKGLNKYPVLETEHLRATIWEISDFEYCMRGYLKDLDWEEQFFDRIHPKTNAPTNEKSRINSVKNHIYERKLGTIWKIGLSRNCIVKIDEMGLIEAIYYICEPRIPEKHKKIIDQFIEVLKKFDDGDPVFSIQEI